MKRKYKNAICYYLDDLTNINDLGFESIKLDEKSLEDIFLYYRGYKITENLRPLCITFHKITACIEDYEFSKYLTLILSDEKYRRCVKNIKKSLIKLNILKRKIITTQMIRIKNS